MFSRHKEVSTFFFWLILKKKNSILFFKNPTLEKGIFFFSIKSSSNCQVLEKRNEKEFDFITERHLEFRWKNKPLDIAEIFVSKVIARQWSGGTTKMYPKHLCGWLTTADQNVHSIRHIVVVICEYVLSQKYSSDVIIYFMHIYFVVTSTKALSNHQFSISFNWRPLCHLGEYVKKFSLPSERRINIKITMMDERQKKSNTEKKPEKTKK